MPAGSGEPAPSPANLPTKYSWTKPESLNQIHRLFGEVMSDTQYFDTAIREPCFGLQPFIQSALPPLDLLPAGSGYMAKINDVWQRANNRL